MVEDSVPARARTQTLSAHWRGHAFLFDRKSAPAYGAPAGLRLLLIFAAMEGILGPRLSLFHWLRLPIPPTWVRVPILLGVSLLLVRFVAGLKLSQIGLAPWRDWNGTEKSYFVQVIVIANVVFLAIFAGRLRAILAEPSLAWRVATVFLPYFLWGFYQEVMYRGILQTELVRRWGPVSGILVSNSLFTFGPLHFYHFTHTSPALPMFAGIFATGLFFAVLFHRSGNLWMVATFHGIGDAYIDGTAVARAGQSGSPLK
jgi:membrane protease YdiL (CAAX protease family)